MCVLKSIAAAFSTFSRIPMPRTEWDEKSLRYMLCAFPLVGAVIGLLLWAWVALCQVLDFGTILFAAGLTLLPLAVSGGIHMDGFCDTSDALASRQSQARKLEILKDPHMGAFAAISLGAYLLAQFSLATELSPTRENIWLLGLSCILSRCLSGLCSLCFPAVGGPGMLRSFRDGAEKRPAVLLLFLFSIFCAVGMLLLFWPGGCAMLIAALLSVAALYLVSRRHFGGMRGDLAGWFLQLAEISMLAALVLTERIVYLCSL